MGLGMFVMAVGTALLTIVSVSASGMGALSMATISQKRPKEVEVAQGEETPGENIVPMPRMPQHAGKAGRERFRSARNRKGQLGSAA